MIVVSTNLVQFVFFSLLFCEDFFCCIKNIWVDLVKVGGFLAKVGR